MEHRNGEMGERVLVIAFTLRLLHIKHPDLVRRCFTASNPTLVDFLLFLTDCDWVLGTLNIIGS